MLAQYENLGWHGLQGTFKDQQWEMNIMNADKSMHLGCFAYPYLMLVDERASLEEWPNHREVIQHTILHRATQSAFQWYGVQGYWQNISSDWSRYYYWIGKGFGWQYGNHGSSLFG